MAFMNPGRHFDVRQLTVEDIEKEQGLPGRFKESSSQGKGGEPVTPQRVQGSMRQQPFQHRTEGGDSVEMQPECEADA